MGVREEVSHTEKINFEIEKKKSVNKLKALKKKKGVAMILKMQLNQKYQSTPKHVMKEAAPVAGGTRSQYLQGRPACHQNAGMSK